MNERHGENGEATSRNITMKRPQNVLARYRQAPPAAASNQRPWCKTKTVNNALHIIC
jgi:hypothetical protein